MRKRCTMFFKGGAFVKQTTTPSLRATPPQEGNCRWSAAWWGYGPAAAPQDGKDFRQTLIFKPRPWGEQGVPPFEENIQLHSSRRVDHILTCRESFPSRGGGGRQSLKGWFFFKVSQKKIWFSKKLPVEFVVPYGLNPGKPSTRPMTREGPSAYP
jgi:hypothetical protein